MTPCKMFGRRTQNASNYQEHCAARVIVTNTKGELIILHAGIDDYFTIPGGRIKSEGEEDIQKACQKNVMETAGCIVAMKEEPVVAMVELWRGVVHQTSYCFTAELVEGTGNTYPDVNGLNWVTFEKAVEVMKGANPKSENGKFMKERDLFFIETFLEKVGKVLI